MSQSALDRLVRFQAKRATASATQRGHVPMEINETSARNIEASNHSRPLPLGTSLQNNTNPHCHATHASFGKTTPTLMPCEGRANPSCQPPCHCLVCKTTPTLMPCDALPCYYNPLTAPARQQLHSAMGRRRNWGRDEHPVVGGQGAEGAAVRHDGDARRGDPPLGTTRPLYPGTKNCANTPRPLGQSLTTPFGGGQPIRYKEAKDGMRRPTK